MTTEPAPKPERITPRKRVKPKSEHELKLEALLREKGVLKCPEKILLDDAIFPAGRRVRYIGPLTGLAGEVGHVVYIDARGWVHVRFRGEYTSMKCAQTNLEIPE